MITAISQTNYPEVIQLLTSNGLSVDDIVDNTKLFALQDEDRTIGTVALEFSGDTGLLRSLAVASDARRKGSGKELVGFIEDYAREKGVNYLYLLTTSARSFFEHLSYAAIDRNDAPEFIRGTKQFNGGICSSATLMKKTLL